MAILGDVASLPKADAYGGVLVSRSRKVLLVEPMGHFGGYAWTFPKGRPAKGEVPADAALREVLEETGYRAEVLGTLPHAFPGTTTTSALLLMGPLGRQGVPDGETASTRWVDVEEAERLISRTTTKTGRDRDLAILRETARFIERGEWNLRPATCREDWRVRPMPERRTVITLDRLYDAAAAKRIRKGWWPAAMEEKWFTWFDAPVLHMHRSWTGFCLYEVTMVPEGDGLRAVSAVVNRDPDQHGGTDDEVDRRQAIWFMDDLFVHAPDGPTTDAFVEAMAQAVLPNYLGSPAVVSGLMEEVVNVAISYVRGESDFNGSWNTMFELSLEVATGDKYVRMPDWHTPAALGKHLVRTFAVKDEPYFADDLSFFVSEAFMTLFLKVRDLLLAFEADPAAEWEAHALPQINALHQWATTAFLGTDVLDGAGLTLANFAWHPAARR